MRRGTAHMSLAIDLDSDPISGSVSNGCKVAQPFTGWIELVAAIEAARSASPEREVSESGGEGG
jgi:hypothetical protein